MKNTIKKVISNILIILWMALMVLIAIHFIYWVVTDKNIIDFLMTQ